MKRKALCSNKSPLILMSLLEQIIKIEKSFQRLTKK
jgi:hypothetical protein